MLLINFEKQFENRELFEIIYKNMQKILPNSDTEEDNFAIFCKSLDQLKEDSSRYFLVARDDRKIVGYFMFKIDGETMNMEEMQIKEEYQGKRFIFRDFLYLAKHKVGSHIKFACAFTNHKNIKAQKILEHLKMDKVEVLGSGIRYRGKIAKW